MANIYSTATCDTAYSIYEDAAKDGKKAQSRKINKTVIVKGALSNEIPRLKGRYGVTEVSAEDLKLLKDHKQFLAAVKGGFISESEPKTFKKDKSAQISEEEMKKKTKAEISTGKAEV
jgi:hypothetical protein